MPALDLESPADPVNHAATLAVLAQAAYCTSDATLKQTIQAQTVFGANLETFGEPFNATRGRLVDTQGFLTWNDRHVVLAFRGTQEWTDVLTDLDARPRAVEGAKIHSGFADAYDSIANTVSGLVKKRLGRGKLLWITGHSLGGALATLAAARLGAELAPNAVYTFGQPAVGDATFGASYRWPHFRFVNNQDPVPLVPLQMPLGNFLSRILAVIGWAPSLPEVLRMVFKHVGTPSFFDGNGNLISEAQGTTANITELTTLLLAGGDVSLALKNWLLAKAGDHAIAGYVRCCRAASDKLNAGKLNSGIPTAIQVPGNRRVA